MRSNKPEVTDRVIAYTGTLLKKYTKLNNYKHILRVTKYREYINNFTYTMLKIKDYIRCKNYIRCKHGNDDKALLKANFVSAQHNFDRELVTWGKKKICF